MSRGFTKPWLFGDFLMNSIGGRSSRYQLAGISIRSALERHHPFFRLLRVIDLGPAIADPNVVWLVVVMHQRVVVFDAALQQQLVGDGRELPPGSDIAGRSLARKLSDELNTLVEHGDLLLACHRDRVLVRIAVNADLVSGIRDGLHLGRKGLDRVAGNEPGGLDAEPLKQLEQTQAADLTGKQAARDVVRRVLAAIGAEPAGYGIHIDAEAAEDFLGHAVGLPDAQKSLGLLLLVRRADGLEYCSKRWRSIEPSPDGPGRELAQARSFEVASVFRHS